MNLELLDPFRRQIPDRVDATLELPAVLHMRKKATTTEGSSTKPSKSSKSATKVVPDDDDDDDDDWKAANMCAFNRRGAYVAVGYGSGTVGVFDVLSRSLTGLYKNDIADVSAAAAIDATTTATSNDNDGPVSNSLVGGSGGGSGGAGHGITSVSWSRRSRTLLAGSAGDAEVRLIDTTHPFGPEQCCLALPGGGDGDNTDHNADDERSQSSGLEVSKENQNSKGSAFFKDRKKYTTHDHHKKSKFLKVMNMTTTKPPPGDTTKTSSSATTTTASSLVSPSASAKTKVARRQRIVHVPVLNATTKRYPSIVFNLPIPVGSSLQIHPRDVSAGLAQMEDGSLVAFWVPSHGFDDNNGSGGNNNNNNDDDPTAEPMVKIATIYKNDAHFITCAAFDPHGGRIYAATKDGKLLGFEVGHVFDAFCNQSTEIPQVKTNFVIHIPGGATVWHLIVSRNGKFLVLNSSDAAIRLYQTNECWMTPEEVDKPTWVFQDVVSKVKFASCDISGDSEFVVGGANGETDSKYELYIWNTSTGALMDKLIGTSVELFSVAWHPTRSFLAVAASDGLVDIWGPRINWTAFAPDFQALPQNVEYVECEDEFDIIGDGDNDAFDNKDDEEDQEKESVDILTVKPVPVFASDSEDEEDVFCFETKVTRLLGAMTT